MIGGSDRIELGFYTRRYLLADKLQYVYLIKLIHQQFTTFQVYVFSFFRSMYSPSFCQRHRKIASESSLCIYSSYKL